MSSLNRRIAGDVNRLTLQPILSYRLGSGWYLMSIPVIIANWSVLLGIKFLLPK